MDNQGQGSGVQGPGKNTPGVRDPIPPRHARLLTLLSLIVLAIALVPRSLWSMDEAIVGAVIRDMVVEGEWLVPHVNGQVYPDKPPLYYWLAALPALVDQMRPVWFRLPAALAAIGSLWLTYLLGARLYNRSTGLLAAAILTASPLFLISAQITRMDMMVMLLVLAMLYCFARGMETGERRWMLAIYPLAGLAFLTKALIGPVMAGFVIGSVLLWQRDWRAWLKIEPLFGPLLFAAVVLPWLIPAVLQEGPGYATNLLLTQSVGRAVESFAHDRPFYYYLYAFPATFLPWLLFLPAALLFVWRRRDRDDWRRPFLLAWTVGLFLLLSAVSGKLVIYLLPLFPALALLVAALWQEALAADDDFSRRLLLWPTIVSVAIIEGIVIFGAASERLPPSLPPWVLYAAAVAVLLAIPAALQTARPLSVRLLGALFITAGLVLGAVKVGATISDQDYTPKRLGRFLLAQRELTSIGTFRIRPGLFNYYAEQRLQALETPEAVREFLDQPAPALCILEGKRLARVWPEGLPPHVRIIRQDKIGRIVYVTVSNREPVSPGPAPL